MAEQTVLVDLLKKNKRKTKFDEEKVRQHITQLLSEPLFPAEQAKVYGGLLRFVEAHFVQQLASKYPVISKEIFDLKKPLECKNHDGTYIAQAPVVTGISLKEKNGTEFKVVLRGKTKQDGNYGADFNCTCPIPEITTEARSAIAESTAYRAELLADAYKDKMLGRIMMGENMDSASFPVNVNYFLVWAPSAWNTKFIERDPAIFMGYANKNFLIHQWEIPEERSLDAMLREFQEDT